MSFDDFFIFIVDRDEKIRVSWVVASYSIEVVSMLCGVAV